ncbi:calpain-8-like isoform X3 [Plodia interpunctella]|uniref:calpain-8-like isoform X3 n=1 Tax=Plodia interpunctella TaxID=58824 RepID=UPI0023685402|nr:calpain-8-like isoform X3 [Plodia interpunctella]
MPTTSFSWPNNLWYWSGSEECGGGALWEDAEFPPARALGEQRRSVQWLRPHELCANPTFFGESLAGGEEEGGGEGSGDDAAALAGQYLDDVGADRWVVDAEGAGPLSCGALWRACAALRGTPRLLARVAAPHSFRRGYCGRFRFRFWVWGEWRAVAVDDRLPARGGRLLGSRPRAARDFTLPLLEKAYAKLHGSYSSARRAELATCLRDVTGGVVQSLMLRPRAAAAAAAAAAASALIAAAPRSTLLVATAATAAPRQGLAQQSGLIGGHPYCVCGLARVRAAEEAAGEAGEEAGMLLRLRAAAGGAWSGAWSAHSAERAALSAADRAQLVTDHDEFWMSFGDFCSWFSQLELVHVGPDDWLREPALRDRRPWRAVLARRRWRRGYNAGGPPSAPTAHTNPQFHVQVEGARACHVVVAVTQQYAPARARRLLAVGVAVYELPGRRPLAVTHHCRARERPRSRAQVATFFTLPAGRYAVVPHTQRAHAEAGFLLRVLTDEHAHVWELNRDNALLQDPWRALSPDLRRLADDMRAILKCDQMEPLDAVSLRTALRRVWRSVLPSRPSLELSRALVALRDARLSGLVAARELPALCALLASWTRALHSAGARAGAGCRAPRLDAYRLRELLAAAGVSASNKVVECLVLRFARGCSAGAGGWLPADAALVALARLHLAHERYRSLYTKMKSNPLSLEEMILMTIYS